MIKLIYLIVIYIFLICAHNVILYVVIDKGYTAKIRKSFTEEYRLLNESTKEEIILR